MAAYKVINLDSPIESDYWVDIPVRDPATNKDAVDEEGRILVKRHVTRSIKKEELTSFNTAVETVNTLKEDYSTFKEDISTKVNSHDSNILTNTNNITTLTESVNNHDLQINALYTKINAIQGIDIDDFKLVTETDIKNIKKDYLPLAGGTITGDLVLSGKVSSNSPIKANLQGTADKAVGDINGKALTSYITNLEVSGASVTVTNGAGETSNYTVNNINHAIHADLAINATNATSADSAIHATHADNLGNYPAADYVRSVNGVNADASGNIQLGNLVKSVNGVKASENGNVTLSLPFVKTVNSTAPDSNGNVVLDLSSSGGVGFPDLSAGVAISNLNGTYASDTTRTYTLPSSGWVIGSLAFLDGSGGGSTASIYLNTVLYKSFYPASGDVTFDFFIPLKSGTQIKIQFQYRGNTVTVSSTLKLYPFLS